MRHNKRKLSINGTTIVEVKVSEKSFDKLITNSLGDLKRVGAPIEFIKRKKFIVMPNKHPDCAKIYDSFKIDASIMLVVTGVELSINKLKEIVDFKPDEPSEPNTSHNHESGIFGADVSPDHPMLERLNKALKEELSFEQRTIINEASEQLAKIAYDSDGNIIRQLDEFGVDQIFEDYSEAVKRLSTAWNMDDHKWSCVIRASKLALIGNWGNIPISKRDALSDNYIEKLFGIPVLIHDRLDEIAESMGENGLNGFDAF